MRRPTETALRGIQSLFVDAAYALVQVGCGSEAVAALEGGRAVLISQALARDRAALALLATGEGDLARRFLSSATQLRALSRLDSAHDVAPARAPRR